jgi:hypothetical protein
LILEWVVVDPSDAEINSVVQGEHKNNQQALKKNSTRLERFGDISRSILLITLNFQWVSGRPQPQIK